MPNFTNTVIYKIVDADTGDILYVGSTTNLIHRKWEHKSRTANQNDARYHLKIYQDIRNLGGWDKVLIIMIEQYPECTDNLQKLKREREWFDKLMPSSNMILPMVTDEERKQYFIVNRDKILIQKKEYRSLNKEKILIQKKEYRSSNKEKIFIQKKEYRSSNKEKINEYKRAKYAAKKAEQAAEDAA